MSCADDRPALSRLGSFFGVLDVPVRWVRPARDAPPNTWPFRSDRHRHRLYRFMGCFGRIGSSTCHRPCPRLLLRHGRGGFFSGSTARNPTCCRRRRCCRLSAPSVYRGSAGVKLPGWRKLGVSAHQFVLADRSVGGAQPKHGRCHCAPIGHGDRSASDRR